MSALGDVVRAMIVEDGPIGLERFMGLALGHPRYGYYMTRDPLGADGDFTTAPEISQMFGELIGLWCVDCWRRMGAPERLSLVELGPGRGTLMADALRAAQLAPDFRTALDVRLVEFSPVLRDRQRATLADAGVPIAWSDDFASIPPGPAIFVANEFFDALPARHYVRAEDGWRERAIGLDARGAFVFGAAPGLERSPDIAAPAGAVLEVNPIAREWMREIAARIAAQGGAALVVDYGYAKPGLGETLQALRGHAFVDPLSEPGEADLTTHVDFAALARAARQAGAQTFGPVGQGEFLRRLGVVERAARLVRNASRGQANAVEAALARLIAEGSDRGGGMGTLFKVLAITQRSGFVPAGFEPNEAAA